MRYKVSDYIADFFANKGISMVFTVVGGGAMHLNDSFGHNPGIHCIYNHHEQASSMAAEAYFRVHNRMAGVCVTSGPGALNALNGVVGAYQDSIPMLVISGQSKTALTVRGNGLHLRALGNQEFDIVSALENMTKYAEMIVDKNRIRYCLEKAYYTALEGRPGPCWLDIPVDIQGASVETDQLEGFVPEKTQEGLRTPDLDLLVKKLMEADRPLLYAGNGIRIAGALAKFRETVKRLNIPVATCWDSIDLIGTDDPCYAGRAGLMGNRSGNFAVQNSDYLLCVGTRLNVYQVGYDSSTWARRAYVVDVDIDPDELGKPTIRVDLPICEDAGRFFEALLERREAKYQQKWEDWNRRCRTWRQRYPVVTEKHYVEKKKVNIYAFMDTLSKLLPDNAVTVVANGSASVVGSQTYQIKGRQRFILNCGVSSMGYDLPAAIGAWFADPDNPVICIAGDGSVQMNLQELQTIITNRVPIKLFIINNNGYHQIRQTQNNVFRRSNVGIGPDSGDLGFPSFEKLAWAYGYPYYRIESHSQMEKTIQDVIALDTYCICEVVCSVEQGFEPKIMTEKLPNGMLYSPPLEDMAPFLPREELKENMLIPLVER